MIENDIEIEEEESEDNYQIAFFDKITQRFEDAYYFYADNDSEAYKIYDKEYSKQYPKDKFTYEIEYVGGLESDRGYEMEVDRGIYM